MLMIFSDVSADLMMAQFDLPAAPRAQEYFHWMVQPPGLA
jgi:hypothetical protein